MQKPLEIILEHGLRIEIDQNEWTVLDRTNHESIENGKPTEWSVTVSQHPDGRVVVYVNESVAGGDPKAFGLMAERDNVIDAVYKVAALRPSNQESIDGMVSALRRHGFQ